MLNWGQWRLYLKGLDEGLSAREGGGVYSRQMTKIFCLSRSNGQKFLTMTGVTCHWC